jgi:hypothetical protein
MAKPKYERQYEQMLKDHQDSFDELKKLDRKSEEFKSLQLKVIRIIRKNEDQLCAKTENTKFANFSLQLADKFWELIRKDYPEVDYSTD